MRLQTASGQEVSGLGSDSGFELTPKVFRLPGLRGRRALERGISPCDRRALDVTPHGQFREQSITIDMCTKSSSQSRSIDGWTVCVTRKPDAVWFCGFARRASGSLAT